MIKLNKSQIIFLIITAISIGAIYFLPNILIPHFYNQRTGDNFGWQDMGSYDFEEMFSYGVSIRDIIDGHISGGDPFLWEYKDMPTSWDYYPLALIIGLFFKIFHLNGLSLFFVIGDFIFPSIAFIIIFFLFFRIMKNFLFSALSSLIFLFFPNLFVFKQLFSIIVYDNFSLLKITELFAGAFNSSFSRLFVPALTIIFFNTFLLLSYKIISSVNLKKRWLVFGGVSYGLLFYVYFYYWVFATVALGFLSLFFIFYKRDIFWRIVSVLAYGLIVSIPYWIRFFILADNPIYNELTQRIGLFYGRAVILPSGGYWVVLFIFLFFGSVFRRRLGEINLFFYALSLLMAVLAVKNVQLIFGFNPQPDHWGSRVNIYVIVFTILLLIFLLIGSALVKYKKSLSIILTAIILFLGVIAATKQLAISQNIIYEQDAPFLEKDIVDSFQWINKNTEADSVFLSSAVKINTALPFYTHANVYLPQACLSLASNSEILERHIDVYAIYGVPADALQDFIELDFANKNYTYIQRRNLNAHYALFCGTYQKFLKDGKIKTNVPREITDNFIVKYKLTKPSIKILKYRADYLYYGPDESAISNFDPDKYPELELAYSNNSVKIYKINPIEYAK